MVWMAVGFCAADGGGAGVGLGFAGAEGSAVGWGSFVTFLVAAALVVVDFFVADIAIPKKLNSCA